MKPLQHFSFPSLDLRNCTRFGCPLDEHAEHVLLTLKNGPFMR
jgi:hypothetical protein